MKKHSSGLEKKKFRCVIYCFEIKMTGRRNDQNLTKRAIVSLNTLKQTVSMQTGDTLVLYSRIYCNRENKSVFYSLFTVHGASQSSLMTCRTRSLETSGCIIQHWYTALRTAETGPHASSIQMISRWAGTTLRNSQEILG